MTLIDYMNAQGINGFTGAILNFSTTVGAIVILFCTVKILFASYQGLRLYILGQLFCNKNNTRKYGDWAIITGAANGIGRSMAMELARRGHSIIAIDIDEKKLIDTKAALESEQNVGKVETIIADLSDTSLNNYEQIEKRLKLEERAIGILINNAGLATKQLRRYTGYDMEEIRRTLNVNIVATAFMTRIVLAQMSARRRGLILNMSSILAGLGTIYMGVYGSSKSFVSEFSSSLNREYSQSHNVDVVHLTPCGVQTDMLEFEFGTVKGALVVQADYFARSALNAIGSGVSSYSGCWSHGFWKVLSSSLSNLGLMSITTRLYMKFSARQFAKRNSNKQNKSNGSS